MGGKFFFIFLFWGAAYAVDFALFTAPKTGTHLMVPLLEELTGKKGIWPHEFLAPHRDCDQETYEDLSEDPDYIVYLWNKKPGKVKDFRHALHKAAWSFGFLYCAAPYTQKMEDLLRSKNTKVFTVLRDPRDTVVSAWQYYLLFGEGVIDDPGVKELPQEEQIRAFLLGTDWRNSARHLFMIFSGWQKSDLCCTVNFTKLLGLYGGKATSEEQLEELRKIASFLDLKKSDRELYKAFDQAYGIGYTFQKNRVGGWKEVFTEEHLKIVDEELGDLLDEYGFER